MEPSFFDIGHTGSVGSLVSAALETAGHSMQSAVLDVFEAGFAADFGALIYVLAAIFAIFIISIGGNYKFGMWFLVGPGIFYFTIAHRIPSYGAQWRIGDREFDPIYVESLTRDLTPPVAGGAEQTYGEVAWLFAYWDDFTSDMVTNFVRLFDLHVQNIDLSFITKVQRYHAFMDARVEDPSLRAFIRLIFIGECRDFVAGMDAVFSPSQRLNSSEELNAEWMEHVNGTLNATVDKHSEALVEAFRAELILDASGQRMTHQDFLDEFVGEDVQCLDVWQYAVRAVERQAANIFGALAGHNLPEVLVTDPDTGLTAPAMNEGDVRDKIVRRVWPYVPHGTECPEHMLPRDQWSDPCQGNPGCDCWFEIIDETNPDAKLILFVREMASRMVLEELRAVYPEVIQDTYNQHDPNFYAKADRVAHEIRESAQGHEYEGKGTYMSAMLAMPYIQGMALYILAVTYPFFAMMLLVPGRHHAFLLWLGMWFWIKAWDIGIAIVMLVDELMFNLMPQGPPIAPETFQEDPARMIKAMLQVDPSFSVNSYFNIMATLIGAVPVITGLLVKRGGGEVVHAVAQGFRDFSGKIGFAVLQYHTALRNQDLAEIQMRREQKVLKRAVAQAWKHPDTMMAFGAEAMTTVARSLGQMSGDSVDAAVRDSIAKNGQFGQAFQTYSRRIAVQGFNKNVRQAMFNESRSVHNTMLAHDAIVNWYSNHDWSLANPWAAEVDYMIARKVFAPGGAESNVAMSFLKSLGRNKILNSKTIDSKLGGKTP